MERGHAAATGSPPPSLLCELQLLTRGADVLLVWHAHMLNPRIYLEDCLRHDHAALWTSGMPWAIVNAAIRGPTFEYVVSEACVAHWTSRTNLAWRNEDDPDTKEIKCPSCDATVSVPWTTCGQEEGYQGSQYVKPVPLVNLHTQTGTFRSCLCCQNEKHITHEPN